MKIPTKHFISIVQSSNRVLLSSQFEPNLSFQGHVGESAHQYYYVQQSSYSSSFKTFSRRHYAAKIIPTTSLLLKNLKKGLSRTLVYVEVKCFFFHSLPPVNTALGLSKNFLSKSFPKGRSEKVVEHRAAKEALLSQLEQLWIWAIESDDGVSFSSASAVTASLSLSWGIGKIFFPLLLCQLSLQCDSIFHSNSRHTLIIDDQQGSKAWNTQTHKKRTERQLVF